MKLELFTPTGKNGLSLDEIQKGDEVWVKIDGKIFKTKVAYWCVYKGKRFTIKLENANP